MKIIRQLIAGTGGWNENPIVRTVRYATLLGIVAGLDALSVHLTPLALPDPAVSVPLVTAATAGAEKWLRNKANASQAAQDATVQHLAVLSTPVPPTAPTQPPVTP